MKKLTKLVTVSCLLAFVSTALLTSGCATSSSFTQNTVDNTAVVLRGAARDGAIIAIQKNPDTARYFELAAAAMETFITGKDYSPGAFQKTLMEVVNPQANDPYVQIALGTAIDLYQLYFGEYVKGKVNGNTTAQAFLTAIQDGFNQALGKPVSAKRYRSVQGVKPASESLLPRPLKRY